MSKFRAILPRLTIYNQCITDDDIEAEGITLSLVWGRAVIEVTFAMQPRTGGAPL